LLVVFVTEELCAVLNAVLAQDAIQAALKDYQSKNDSEA